MSIEDLVDEAVLCIQCGASKRIGCTCWVQLQCPCCDARRTVRRDDSDPPETAVVVYACPSCRAHEPDDVQYFDEHGNELFEDEDE